MERIHDLEMSAESEAKLDDRGLSINDVYDVIEGRPVFLRQKAADELAPDGSLRRRPARIQVIGPDLSGRMLTFIIEQPIDGVARVVTGWLSSKEQRDHYRNATRSRRP